MYHCLYGVGAYDYECITHTRNNHDYYESFLWLNYSVKQMTCNNIRILLKLTAS